MAVLVLWIMGMAAPDCWASCSHFSLQIFSTGHRCFFFNPKFQRGHFLLEVPPPYPNVGLELTVARLRIACSTSALLCFGCLENGP